MSLGAMTMLVWASLTARMLLGLFLFFLPICCVAAMVIRDTGWREFLRAVCVTAAFIGAECLGLYLLLS